MILSEGYKKRVKYPVSVYVTKFEEKKVDLYITIVPCRFLPLYTAKKKAKRKGIIANP